MKVRCINNNGMPFELTLNREYIVLEEKENGYKIKSEFNREWECPKSWFSIIEEKESDDMEKYKMWEVLKMIEENKELKFTDDIYDIFYDKDFNIVRFINKSNHKISITGIGLGKEFYLINQPVTFEEVLNSDKRCKVEHELLDGENKYETFDNLMFRLSNSYFGALKEIIKNGKWYLED